MSDQMSPGSISAGPPSQVIRSASHGADVASGLLPRLSQNVRLRPVKQARPPKKPLAERLPEGVYASRPQMKRFVLHWFYFWVYAGLQLCRISMPVPRVAMREQIRREGAELFELAKTRQPSIAVVNKKGGSGKSAMATWLAVLIKRETHREVVIVDSNENGGSTAGRLGIRRDQTVTLRAFLGAKGSLGTPAALTRSLASHGSGVQVIASEDMATRFSQRVFVERMTELRAMVHTLVMDAGNGIPHAANRGAVEIADVVVTPATVMQADSFPDAQVTRELYSSFDLHYGFGDKIKKGIIVLLGVTDSQRLEYIERFGWNSDKVFVIPKDSYMMGEHVVDWSKLRTKTQLALLRVAVAIFKATQEAALWKNGSNTSQGVDGLNLPDLEELPSFAIPPTMEG